MSLSTADDTLDKVLRGRGEKTGGEGRGSFLFGYFRKWIIDAGPNQGQDCGTRDVGKSQSC